MSRKFLPFMAFTALSAACHPDSQLQSDSASENRKAKLEFIEADIDQMGGSSPSKTESEKLTRKTGEVEYGYGYGYDTGAPDLYEEPMLNTDSSGTLSTGETVTLTVDAGSASVYSVRWDLDGSETVNDGYPEQQARWSEPGTYTVSAEFTLDDGSNWSFSQTFTVLEFGMDVMPIRCEDGSWGLELILLGTHDAAIYGIYGSSDLRTWSAVDTAVIGDHEETLWQSCGQIADATSYFFQAAIEDNPDGDEWTTGEELFVTETDPWMYEDPISCLLVEDDGSWESLRTSAEVCEDYLGAICGGIEFAVGVEVGSGTTTNTPKGAAVPAGWARDAANNGTKSTGYRKGINPYIPHLHDCEDFAREFEDAIEADGHEATITLVFEFDRKTCTKLNGGHALNDFHDAHGRIGFWEPQTNQVVDLDLDKDGSVSLAKRAEGYLRPTERSADGRCIGVETFDDYDEVTRIYGTLDP